MTNVELAISKVGDKTTFAKLMGVSRATVHKWCRTGEVSDSYLETFCRITRVDPTTVSSKAKSLKALMRKL